RELDPPRLDVRRDAREPLADQVGFLLRDDAAAGQHAGVGLACPDVFLVQSPVETDGRMELIHGGRRALGEAAAPKLFALAAHCRPRALGAIKKPARANRSALARAP